MLYCCFDSGTPTIPLGNIAICENCSSAFSVHKKSCTPQERICGSSWWMTRAAC